jgi:drug/metabolite transporter (DMT)-like permease
MIDKKGLGLVFLTAIISGMSIFLNKFGVGGIDPSVFTFAKNVVVAVCLFSLILLFGNIKSFANLTGKQWVKLMVIGLVGGSIPFLLFFRGLQLTSAASASFVHKTMFVWVAILAAVFLRNKIPKKMVVAGFVLLLGNLLLLQLRQFSIGTGEIMIFGATLLWAMENVVSKSALRNLEGKTVAFGRMFFGSVFILGFLAATGKVGAAFSLSMSHISWILVTGLLLLLYLLSWYDGLKRVDPTVATCVLLIGSPVTTLLDVAFSGRIINVPQVIGIALLAAGTAVVIWIYKKSMSRSASQIISTANPR